MTESTNEPYGLDSALGPATPFDLVLAAFADARNAPAYDHAPLAARLLSELGFGAGNVCFICDDPSDHGGAPHSLATGDGRTREHVLRERDAEDDPRPLQHGLVDFMLRREAEASVALSRDPDMQTHYLEDDDRLHGPAYGAQPDDPS